MTSQKNPITLLQRAVGILAIAAVLGSTSSQSSAQSPTDAVKAVISSLQETWNSGDMDGYLARYAPDESLRLTFGNTVVEGWSALDALFRESYPDPYRMGRFTIDRVDVQLLSADVAVAYGNFTHVFPHETIKGGFSHALTREANGGWIIRHERTSRAEVITHD